MADDPEWLTDLQELINTSEIELFGWQATFTVLHERMRPMLAQIEAEGIAHVAIASHDELAKLTKSRDMLLAAVESQHVRLHELCVALTNIIPK